MDHIRGRCLAPALGLAVAAVLACSAVHAGEKVLTLPGTNYYNLEDGSHYDDAFGAAVAISGDHVLVSAPNWDPAFIADEADIDDMDWGTGWIFRRDLGGSNNWGMVTRLIEASPRYDPYGRNDRLGTAVAMDGSVAVICSGETALSPNWNAEYGACAIFYQDEGGPDNWGLWKWVQGTTNSESEHYGYACALSGDFLVVGERNHESDGDGWNGAAFIYYRHNGHGEGWGVVKSFTGYPGYAAFGCAVDIDAAASPRRVIVGADYAQDGQAGSAYIYEQGVAVTTWSLAVQKNGDVGGDQFGHAVAVHGNWAVVGAPHSANGGTRRGKVYVYQRSGAGIWNLADTLTPPDAADHDAFGSTVAMDDGSLLIGASGDDPAGSVYLYTLQDGAWSFRRKLTGSGTGSGDGFGYFYSSVTTASVSGGWAVVGAPGYDTAHNDEGAAFLFDLSGTAVAPTNFLLLQ